MGDFSGVDILSRIADNLAGRVDGPMKFRLLLQPLMAITFVLLDIVGYRRVAHGLVRIARPRVD